MRRGEFEQDTFAIHSTLGTDALDNFLTRVAALVEADVRVFDGGFVRNDRVVEVGGEPWDTGFESKGIEREHSYGSAPVGTNCTESDFPELGHGFARDQKFRAGLAEVRAANDAAGNPVHGRLVDRELRQIGNGRSRHIADHLGGVGAFDGEAGGGVGRVFEPYLRAENIFPQGGDGLVAQRNVGTHENGFCEGVNFQFGENPALRVEKNGQNAAILREFFDVAGSDRVEVFHAVAASEIESEMPVGVEEDRGLARRAVFLVERGEAFGQKAAVEFADVGRGCGMGCEKGGFEG